MITAKGFEIEVMVVHGKEGSQSKRRSVKPRIGKGKSLIITCPPGKNTFQGSTEELAALSKVLPSDISGNGRRLNDGVKERIAKELHKSPTTVGIQLANLRRRNSLRIKPKISLGELRTEAERVGLLDPGIIKKLRRYTTQGKISDSRTHPSMRPRY